MKKKLFFLLTLIMIFSLGVTVTANDQSKENVSFYLRDEVYQDILENEEVNQSLVRQSAALKEYSSIVSQLNDDQLGGAFFGDDGKLHVLITEDIPMPESLEADLCYDVVTYSYSQLETFQNVLISRRKEIGFDASGIDQEENVINIYCADMFDEDLIYELVPKNAVKIVAEQPVLSDYSTHTVVPGQKLTNTTRNSSGTISCAVVWDDSTSDKKYGFLTAGHLCDVGDSVSYDGASMGTVTQSQQSGSVDAALIQRGQNSNVFNSSNEVADGKVFSTYGGVFPKNTVIYAYGAATTYEDDSTISGKITNTSYSGTFNDIYFTGLILTDAVSQRGDSGGPVLTAFGDEYAITGIIKGGVNDKMVYVSMLEIANAFDLSVMRP